MNQFTKSSLLVILSFALLGSVASSQQKLQYFDHIYSPKAKTVQLTPKGNTSLPAVVRVGTPLLQLSFDWMGEDADYFNAKIISCDRSWNPSGLSSLEYLLDYNEFNLNTYEFSFDDRTPYVHFTFDIPAITRSGNYLLVVHYTDQPDNIIITRRVRVVQPLVQVNLNRSLTGLTNLSALNQQIDFTIRYPQYKLDNPLSFVNVDIRQNQRDDNAVTGLKPAFIREHINELEYRFFDHQNTFAAVNEYRFFDLKSLVYPGQNVRTINRNSTPPQATIEMDRPKKGLAYAEYDDNNGQYHVPQRNDINGLYVDVNFTLDASKVGNKGDVYVYGELTNWEKDNANKMRYNPSTRKYEKALLLKEGFYEYQYLMKNDSLPEYYMEGNHAQAENGYEIFVYYRPPSERSDLLIGYLNLTKSGRN